MKRFYTETYPILTSLKNAIIRTVSEERQKKYLTNIR